MPEISVIIPCYNVEKYVSECLDSVLNQTFFDFEIICIEDCSTDNTPNLLKRYADKNKVRVLYNERNKGLALSRNIGLKEAKGNYIYFLDSDDTITPNCLQILYDKASQDNVDIAMSQMKAYSKNTVNAFCINHTKHLNEWLMFEPFSKQSITEDNALEYYHKLHCCAVNKLYKKSFLLENGIYFIHKKCFHEDNGFWFKILACNPTISGIDDTTYFYRVRNGSISEKMDKSKKAHHSNFKLSLIDALQFVKSKNNTVLSETIQHEINAIQGKYNPVSFIWTKNEKYFKLFFFYVFRLKFNPKKNQSILKILGAPVYKRRKK